MLNVQEPQRQNALIVTVAAAAIALVVCLFALEQIGGLSIHALEKHGEEAIAVRNCLDQNGPAQIWQLNERTYLVCILDDGRFGISIEDAEGNITAFIRNKAKTIQDVIRYLERQGAELIWDATLP